ncbi:DUF89 domain-containing protein [Auricularia subglabra TFB-10046 SS5]|nr:DUF89 domain-containing protein [Auricularia subglabra TFB-10046 SS5]
MASWTPPYPPSDPTDKSSFSYETVLKRWPIIITGLIDRVYRDNHLLLTGGTEDDGLDEDEEELDEDEKKAKVEEGKEVIAAASKLKYEMARDRPLDPIPEDGVPLVEEYNARLNELEKDGKNTWFKAPWLFAECYLYRLFRSWFAQTKYWTTYDPFRAQKIDAFKSSGAAVYKLANTMHELASERDALLADPEKLEILFKEMLQICLWGNATDLSLLTNLTHEDIQKLQTVEKDAQAARAKFILHDDSDAAWARIKSLKDGRVDIVLDNSGFELFTDLIFADFLLTYTPFVSKVVFHPKSIPWFVSDVTPADFAWTLDMLSASPAAFFSGAEAHANEHLAPLVARWNKHAEDGRFELRMDDWWTHFAAYHHTPARLREALGQSGLVVFKGDLNYRKLTGDAKWPVDTPFEEAIGPLRGAFPLLALRTNKADVIVGVPADRARAAEAEDARWRVSGRYAVVAYAAA